MIRRIIVFSVCICIWLITNASAQIAANSELQLQSNPSVDGYRGYVLDLTQIAGQQNLGAIAKALHHQIDIVEGVGLSERVLRTFRKVPMVADDLACLESTRENAASKKDNWACYGFFPSNTFQGKSLVLSHLYDDDANAREAEIKSAMRQEAKDLAYGDELGRGIIMFRPNPVMFKVSAELPILLHELLHFYHGRILPEGSQYAAIMVYYETAKNGKLYPEKEYVLSNQMEFFAVTASIFLYGSDYEHAPHTRAQLKDAQPDYYRFLVWLFGFDPANKSGAPVASAN